MPPIAADPAQYAALAERAAFADRSACGRLRIAGADALDLLNRLTTNDLSSLPDGTARSTVLTNGDARVIDHLRLAAADGAIWCIASPGRAEAVAEWIDLYTFSEDVAVTDVSSETAQFAVAGPLAADALAAAGFPVPALDSVESLGPHPEETVPDRPSFPGRRESRRREAPLLSYSRASSFPRKREPTGTVAASPFGAHIAYDVLLPLADADYAIAALRDAVEEADAAAFDAYRVAQGVPAYGAEFGAFNNPLEARLLGSISDEKGCYTGQEVIARLQTYRKVQRLLMAFTASAPADSGDALADADGSPVGAVTSACDVGGRVFGLALVAAKHAVEGAALRLANGGEVALSEPAYAAGTEG